MKIIIIGDGKVGTTITENISKEGHDVTIIDNNPIVVENLVNKYDCMGIVGSGASYEILKSAGVKGADIVIASTSSDEINILSCLFAKNLGASSTIARIRNYEYNEQIEEMKQNLGLTMTINPESETANDILNIINFPEAIHVDRFGDGKVDLVEIYIPSGSLLIGTRLMDIYPNFKVKVLVCAVQRDDEVIIPTGTFRFEAKDKIYVNAERASIKKLLSKIGLMKENKIKKVMIIGGGRITAYLADGLLKSKYDVTIIEQNYDRCLVLEELFPKATIIHGDGGDQALLEEVGIDTIDCLVSLTGMDEENIIISMYAYQKQISKIIAKVDKHSFSSIIGTIGVASVVSPKDITASRIISYVRSKANKHGSNIINLYKLIDGRVEAIEFKAKPNSKILNKALKDIKLKPNNLIGSIIRNKEVIIPSGLDQIKVNDSVIVVSLSGQFIDDLDDILE